MNRWISLLLVLLALFFVLPIVTVDKLVNEGTYTLEAGKTLHGGMVITSGEVTIEEGARVTGGVFKSAGVLTVNGEVAGTIFSTSGDVRLGPRAVVGGHVVTSSVATQVAAGARIEDSATATVASWLGGEGGAALKLLVLAAIVLYRPMLVGLRTVAGAPERPLAAQPSWVLALGLVLVALGVFLPLERFGVSLSAGAWAAVFLAGGGLLFVLMTARRAAGLALPASVLAVTGLVLLYQEFTGHWESWAYAWALVLPGAIGVGQIIAGWWRREPRLEHTGMRVAGAGAVLFLLSAVFFEGVVPASGAIGVLAISLLLLAAGVYLLSGAGPRPGGRPTG